MKKRKNDIYIYKRETEKNRKREKEPQEGCSPSIPLLLFTKAHGLYTLFVCVA